jgi:hypothetical protein
MATKERTTWVADTGLDCIDDLIEENVKEAVVDYVKELIGYFPKIYYPKDGGTGKKKPPKIALTFRVFVEDGVKTEKDFDLEELIMEDAITCYEDGSYLAGFRQIAASLTRLATMANAVVEARDAAGVDARLDISKWDHDATPR